MAQDATEQRRRIAVQAMEAVANLGDAIYLLEQLRDQRARLVSPFVDADFDADGLRHLSAGQIGVLFDFVVPGLADWFLDLPSGGRNSQILLQVRPGGRSIPIGIR